MDEKSAREAFETAFATQKPVFGEFFLARLLGLDISYPGENCVIEFEVKDFMFNPQGVLHGGVTAFVLDVSMGHLVNHSAGAPGATLEMKTQYLRAVSPGLLRCEARFLKKGRRIGFLESHMSDSSGNLLASATATFNMPG